jgi:para-aminobenzoate synthetase component 1
MGKKLTVTENGRQSHKQVSALWPTLRRLMRKYKPQRCPDVPYFTGGAVGFWGYEMAAFFEPLKFRKKTRWGQVPDLHLGFYRSVVIYDHKTHCYYLAAQDQTGSIFKEMRAFVSPASVVPEEKRCKFQFSRFKAARNRADFEKAVRKAKRYIAAGDIYQANLSQRFHFDYSGSSLALYGALRTINPSPFSVFLKSDSLDIVSSSPERLVSKRSEWCETKPIAGTRPRVRRREQALKRELLNNEKERAEHLMLVDLERNDLGRVCRWPTVKVNEFMSVEKYSHVMHLVSRITGQLKSDQDVWDLIQAMFPGGTITGCPKIRCMEIIDELEPLARISRTARVREVLFNYRQAVFQELQVPPRQTLSAEKFMKFSLKGFPCVARCDRVVATSTGTLIVDYKSSSTVLSSARMKRDGAAAYVNRVTHASPGCPARCSRRSCY